MKTMKTIKNTPLADNIDSLALLFDSLRSTLDRCSDSLDSLVNSDRLFGDTSEDLPYSSDSLDFSAISSSLESFKLDIIRSCAIFWQSFSFLAKCSNPIFDNNYRDYFIKKFDSLNLNSV